MEIQAGDGQLCIVKTRDHSFKISECQRLARIADEAGRPPFESFSAISTLARAISNRYGLLSHFEIHAFGLTITERAQLQELGEHMKNIEKLRFIGDPLE